MERQVGEEIREGVAIQLLVDISSSMEQSLAADDGERLSRLEAMKRVVEQFIRHRPNDLIGLITFARYADTLSPLTYGHDALVEIIRELDIQDRPGEDGTGYGDALTLSCARLDQMRQWQSADGERTDNSFATIRSMVAVLLTDGENNCGKHLPEEAAGLAAKWGIRVYAISMKDDEGGSALERRNDDEGLTDAEKLLRRLADETGGAYWKIGNVAHLQEVYERIDRSGDQRDRDHDLVSFRDQPLVPIPRRCRARLAADCVDLAHHVVARGRGGEPMSLSAPWMLLCLSLVAVTGWLMARSRRLQGEAAFRLTGVAAKDGRGGLTRRDWLTLASLICVVVALARPQWSPRPYETERRGRDLVIALDVSRSMLAADIFPSRLEMARIAIHEALPALSGQRVSLVTFAGSALVRVPLTLDHGFVRYVLERADPSDMDLGSTSLAGGIREDREYCAE